jgi:glyoxylase I family protein
MRIHHLALRTQEVDVLLAFYSEVLGLAVAKREDDRAWLDAGDAVMMLERAGHDEPPIARGTRELIAFAITRGEREAFEQKLVKHGISIEERSRFTLYFRDPDGRRIGVSHFPTE